MPLTPLSPPIWILPPKNAESSEPKTVSLAARRHSNHVRHKIVELIGSEPESATPAGAPKAAVNERYIIDHEPAMFGAF